MENIIDFFNYLSETELNTDLINELSTLYNTDLNQSYEVVRLLISQMSDEDISFSDKTKLLSQTKVKDFANKNSNLIPLFQMSDNYICYNPNDKNFSSYDIKLNCIIITTNNMFELLEDELISNNVLMPKGQFVSLPFLYLKNNQENYCIFGYDLVSEKNKHYFKVNNLIINSEKSYDCKIVIPVDMEKYEEYYKEVYQAYSTVQPEDLEELESFLKSDMTDEKLLKKYEAIVKIANDEETNVQKATEILNKEFDAGYLTESRCLDIIHEYNKHANIGRLYEMTINDIKANNI